MNTSSLTAGRARSGQPTTLRAEARRLHERLAVRAGLALLKWSRRQEERRTSEAVRLRRQTELLATQLRHDEFARLALLGSPML